MINYIIAVVLVALGVKFLLTLADKWYIREWLQLHTEGFLHKLFLCDFCCSFHLGMIICIFLAIFINPIYLTIPIFSSVLR